MATTSAVDSYKVSELLKGSGNYRTWKFSMRMTLQAKELWEVVGGSEGVKPESDPKGTWDKRAKKALAIIALGMSAAEQEHIIDCETPKEAWEILAKLYEGQGRNRKFMLLHELFHISMESATSMDDYLRAIREKMSELSAVGTKLDKDIKLAIMLNGLSEGYRYLVVNVEQQETVDFDELSARLIEEERLIKSNDSGGSKLAWMARTKQSARSSGECYYCGQQGHFKADCPVRKFRQDKDGEMKHARVARATISM